MLYRIVLPLLLLCSCSSLKDVGQSTLEIIGEVIIDDEIYEPIIRNRNNLALLGSGMSLDDKNVYHFDVLKDAHNTLISKMALQIEENGTIIYEDYKLEILRINNQIEQMKSDYPEKSYQDIPDSVLVLIKNWIRDYSRKQVARGFRNKFSYPVI